MAVGTIATLYRRAGYCTVIPPTPWSYEEYGKNMYLKSQFRALRTPQQREASKAKHKMMAPHTV